MRGKLEAHRSVTDVVGMSVVDRTVVEGSRTQRCGGDVSGGQDRGGRVENSKMWCGYK